MKQNAMIKTAVALALASMAAAASAGTFTGANVGSSASLYATENFGAATPFIAADNITLPAATSIVFNTGAGSSGGFVISPGGSVFIFFKLSNATFNAAPIAGDFTVTGINATDGTALTPSAVALSTDKTTVMLTVTNTTTFPAVIGSGSGVTFNVGASATANVLNPTAALRSAGAAVTVTGGISGVVPGSANNFATDVDAASATNVLTTATDISGSVTANASPTKIAVDAINQRKAFLTGALVANLGTITFTDSVANELQVDGTTNYLVTAPAGRTFDVTVTAGAGSFNAGGSATTTVRIATNAGCTAFVGTAAMGTGNTSATITGVPVTTLPVFACYSVTGTTQINEVTGITATAALGQPAGGINDATLSVSGNLAPVLNDGTVVDLRNYVPASANQFGFSMLLRVINTGNSAADVFGSFINSATGAVGTQGTLASGVAAGAVAELDNNAIEAVLGAPAVGANPRLRISAPTSALSIQLWMRTNGTWVNVTEGQTNSSTPSSNSFDPSRQ